MAHSSLRRLLESHLGAPGRALLAWRTRRRAEALLARRGLAAPGRSLARQLGDRVQRGPFAGLHYPRRRGDIVQVAKLLGAYECELHGALERLIARAPGRVVNIGSGDGYLAVGLARRLPTAEVFAVDPDPIAQRGCAATAALNGVAARIRHVRQLDTHALERVLRAPANAVTSPATSPTITAFCLVDCEGCEDDLLDPRHVPALRQTDILVETHDFVRAGVTERMAARFAETHDVVRVVVAPRIPAAYPELAPLPLTDAAGLLDEFRHMPQAWLVLLARDRRP